VAAIAVGILALTPAPARALGFSGAYDPTNWTTSFGGGGDGSVDTSGAPGSIEITGPNNGRANSYIDYTIAAPVAGVVTFSWLYGTSDIDVGFDSFGYVVGGVYSMLTDDATIYSSDTTTFGVNAGDVFGFRVFSVDADFDPGIATIYSFSGPDPSASTAVPGPLPLLGVAAAFGFSRKLRGRIRDRAGVRVELKQPKGEGRTGAKECG
jgi:hypothetical protein